MVELQTLANYAEIFGALTVLGGLLFAGLQIRSSTQQRRDAAATALLTSHMDNPVIVEYARQIMTAGDDLVAAAENDPSLRQAIAHINAVSESIGFLVHNGSITIQQAADWGGGGIVATWKKIEPYARHQRAESGRNGAFDWFEWLAKQFERHTPDQLRTTIVERYADWKPKR